MSCSISARALAQARPTMTYILLVNIMDLEFYCRFGSEKCWWLSERVL